MSERSDYIKDAIKDIHGILDTIDRNVSKEEFAQFVHSWHFSFAKMYIDGVIKEKKRRLKNE